MAQPDGRETLYLVDGSGYIFRAFYAIRGLSTSDGFPTNALYGFTQMLVKLVDDEAPQHLAVVFDHEGETFRHAIYPDYKGNRPKKPEDLIPQLPLVRDIVRAFRIPALEVEGYEADDVIATLVARARAEGLKTVIVSSDKDLMQLVDEDCVLYDTMKGIRYDAAGVEDKLGVPPGRVVDLLALMGDSSDNIPGVPGIGPKTAATLLAEHGSLEGVYDNLGSIRGKRRENLERHRDDAVLSRRLATLADDVELDLDFADLARSEPDREALSELFRRLEFTALYRDYHAPGAAPAGAVDVPTLSRDAFRVAWDADELAALVRAAEGAERIALTALTSEPHPIAGELVGLSVAVDEARAWYLPLRHRTLEAGTQLDPTAALDALRPLLEDAERPKAAHDTKRLVEVLAREGITVRGVDFDPMLASYLLDAGRYAHTLPNIALTWLDHKALAYADVAGSGARQKRPDQVPIETLAPHACEEAQLTLCLAPILGPRLTDAGLDGLLRDMELPLAAVLADMELAGIRVDVDVMAGLSAELGARADALEARAHEAAGRTFSLGSPKQLAEVLFGDLGLTPIKKTRTGYSTDSSVLEELASEHPLPELALEWRHITKLKSTYTDVLPTLVDPRTGRIHTLFNQAVAATGRLSSEAPNLQNIPIRTEDGRRIRAAFVPAEGARLFCADYSQIELRILAHLSGDERMQRGFAEGADIHRRTAAEMLEVPEDAITSEQRGMAKAINFGILYGMSAFRLSREQGLSRQEAKAYIDAYYARYPRIRAWKQEILEAGRRDGYVSTLFGRIRNVADLGARNGIARAAAERIAVNTPVQGSAADIIKAAMIAIHRRLSRELPSARLLLQVHDELVFEVPESDVDALRDLAVTEMTGVVTLDVPLVVNAAAGATWLEAH